MNVSQSPMDRSLTMRTSRSTTDTGISTLPDEILREIFVLSSDLSPASNQVLCSVSRRWRYIALACSGLWSTVFCDVDKQFPPTQLLELWIERSHHALVDIRIKSRSESANAVGEKREYMRRALDILLPHCHRWKKLAISVPFGQANAFTGVTLRNAVELDTVEVSIDKKDNPLMGVIATAPSIKYLKWQTWRLVASEVRLVHDFPWEKLLRISLSYQHPWTETSQIVSRCTSAKVMILYVPLLIFITAFPPDIHLPNLRTLNIVGCDDELPLIRNLDSPNLSVLYAEIEGTEGITNTAIRQLCRFLRSGKHNLRMLKVQINNKWLTEEEARMVLQASRESNIPSVDIHIPFDSWSYRRRQGGGSGMNYSFLTDEFQGARIADATAREVVFGWLDLRAIDSFISEFRKVPDVDMAGARPFYELASPETTDEALKMKVKRALKLFPKF